MHSQQQLDIKDLQEQHDNIIMQVLIEVNVLHLKKVQGPELRWNK